MSPSASKDDILEMTSLSADVSLPAPAAEDILDFDHRSVSPMITGARSSGREAPSPAGGATKRR